MTFKMKEMLRRVQWGTVLTLILLFYVVYQRLPAILKNYRLEEELFPNQILLTLGGGKFYFPPQGNHPNVALFWTTWCGPCRLEMERIQSAIDANKIQRDRIFAVHIGGDAESVQSHMNKFGFTFPALIDPDGRVASALEVSATPTLFLIDKDRRVEWASSGLGLSDVWRIQSFLSD